MKRFLLEKKGQFIYICSKIPFSGNWEITDLVHGEGVKIFEDLRKHFAGEINIRHFIVMIPSSEKVKPYRKCIVWYKRKPWTWNLYGKLL